MCSKKMGRFVLPVIACLAAGALWGCAPKQESGLIKEYNPGEKVNVRLFGNRTLNSAVWNHEIAASDGKKIQIMEETAEYYGGENGEEGYRTFLANRLKTDSDVDLYMLYDEDVLEFEKKGLFMDLSDTKAAAGLSDAARQSCTCQGKVFGIPLVVTGYGFYWNLDILGRYGLEIPETEEEFLSVCRTLKQNGEVPYIGNKGYGLTVPAMVKGFAGLYADPNRKQKLAELADGTTPVSNYMEKGFEFLVLLRDEGLLDTEYSKATTPNEAIADFAAGKGACLCAHMGADLSGAQFPYRMTGVPLTDGAPVSVVGGARRIAVNPSSENLQYAVEALEYIGKPENLRSVARELNGLTSVKREEGQDDDYLKEETREFAALAQSENQIPIQDFTLPFDTWIQIRDLGREILNGLDAGDAAKKYDEIQMSKVQTAR